MLHSKDFNIFSSIFLTIFNQGQIIACKALEYKVKLVIIKE